MNSSCRHCAKQHRHKQEESQDEQRIVVLGHRKRYSFPNRRTALLQPMAITILFVLSALQSTCASPLPTTSITTRINVQHDVAGHEQHGGADHEQHASARHNTKKALQQVQLKRQQQQHVGRRS